MRFIAMVLFVILLPSSIVFACKCRQPPAPKVALEASSAVFSGKVTNIETDNQGIVRITFEISRTWKGTKESSVKVSTATTSAACGYKFKKGESYLVYCYRSDSRGKKPGILHTNICTRTRSLKMAVDDLKELGEGKKPKPA
jgi:hypothetical protein